MCGLKRRNGRYGSRLILFRKRFRNKAASHVTRRERRAVAETFAKVLRQRYHFPTVKEGPGSRKKVRPSTMFWGQGSVRAGCNSDWEARLIEASHFSRVRAGCNALWKHFHKPPANSLLARACGMQLRRLSSACDPTLLHSVRRCQTA